MVSKAREGQAAAHRPLWECCHWRLQLGLLGLLLKCSGWNGRLFAEFWGHRLPRLRCGAHTPRPRCTAPGVAAAGAGGLRGRVHHPDWCSHRGLRYLG